MSEQAPPQVEVSSESEWPDPSTVPAEPVPAPVPPYIPMLDPYVQYTLGTNGLILSLNGHYAINQAGLVKKMAGIAEDRVVTEDNLDQLPDLGITRGDTLWLAWGRPIEDTITHPQGTDFLMGTAYRTLTPKGAVNGLLPHGMTMVETGTKELTRMVTNNDGTPGLAYIRVRVATTVPERYLVYRVNPIADKAHGYMESAINAILKGNEEYPEAEEMWIAAFHSVNTETAGLMSKGLRELGLGYKPAEITSPTKKSKSD